MAPAPNRRWFQFELRTLFVAVTMVAMGAGGVANVVNGDWSIRNLVFAFGLWFASGALIGAGLFHPFKRMSLGAILGFAASWLIGSLL